MSTDVSEAAVEEVSTALIRNFASFNSQQWIDTATALVKSDNNQAAVQLAPGETVEWLTPGVVHRSGKVWPGAVLMVTPHRLIVSATRGSIRTKREISSLYRGPESLMSVSHRLLPGTSADHWMLEIATQQGPFLFAIPNFTGADALAQITGAFIARRAQYTPQTGVLLDGAPWGAHVPTQRTASVDEGDPFEAAKADLAADPEGGLYPWTDQPAAADTPTEPVEAPFWNPAAQAPAAAPAAPSFWSPPEPTAEPAAPSFWSPTETEPSATASAPPPLYTPANVDPEAPVESEHDSGPETQFWQPFTDEASEPESYALPAQPEPDLEPEPEPIASLPAADWYADPLSEAGLRYWDGQAWTHSTAN